MRALIYEKKTITQNLENTPVIKQKKQCKIF